MTRRLVAGSVVGVTPSNTVRFWLPAYRECRPRGTPWLQPCQAVPRAVVRNTSPAVTTSTCRALCACSVDQVSLSAARLS